MFKCKNYNKINYFDTMTSFLGTIYVVPGTRNPILILDCNEYTIYSKQNDKTRWRCSFYFKTKCKSKLVTFGKIVQVLNEHNHDMKTSRDLSNCLTQHVNILRNG